LLAGGISIRPHTNIGTRSSFADLAATIAGMLGLAWRGAGQSFMEKIVQ
jgi:phosphopentomutase